jgi:hypothetical protein
MSSPFGSVGASPYADDDAASMPHFRIARGNQQRH